ncbi:MAG TPA: sensor histidine kinase [Candidatus Limnocylindria bacterium]|nr:sensor histidine kinase [Candidatus Limnocylindria bacterium]
MKPKLTGLLQEYPAALRHHLTQKSGASLEAARSLGRAAVSMGLETLDVARIHEHALLEVVSSYSPGARNGVFRRAGFFFAETITPIEKTHRTAREANDRLSRLNESLRQRAVALAASNRQLKKEIIQRQAVEEALRKSERHYSELLQQSREMQEQLRHLSHQLLSAQEEERKTISRELHDEIAQTLTGINVQLGSLKTAAAHDIKDLQTKITNTQRLVEKSVKIVHKFARELRPSVLDDLGLIPALHSFVKSFSKRTHIGIRLRIFAGVEQLDGAKRTMLYRVAQESLTNVARHARATQVEMCIEKVSDTVRMKIKDNGKSFSVEQMLRAKKNNRLGLLGMRERIEMVGGHFSIESAPGQGTTVEAQIPFRARARKVTQRLGRRQKGLNLP